jgi:broad specificity phosphatase PhoE
VSHNFPILAIVCRVTHTHLNDYRAFHLDPCSVTRLQCNGNGAWELTHINNQSYPSAVEPPLSQAR